MEGKRASLRAKSAPLVLAWLVTTFGGSLARAEALSPNEKHYFHIEETSLTIAIQKLSKQANIQIITSIDTTHKTGNKVSGVMSTQHALALLLEGQSIKAEYVAGGYILREDVKEPDPSIPRLESEDIENVVVTGYRDSLLQALARKRAAVGSQDSIVAEDIAAFPDLNLAESLQQIPVSQSPATPARGVRFLYAAWGRILHVRNSTAWRSSATPPPAWTIAAW